MTPEELFEEISKSCDKQLSQGIKILAGKFTTFNGSTLIGVCPLTALARNLNVRVPIMRTLAQKTDTGYDNLYSILYAIDGASGDEGDEFYKIGLRLREKYIEKRGLDK